MTLQLELTEEQHSRLINCASLLGVTPEELAVTQIFAYLATSDTATAFLGTAQPPAGQR